MFLHARAIRRLATDGRLPADGRLIDDGRVIDGRVRDAATEPPRVPWDRSIPLEFPSDPEVVMVAWQRPVRVFGAGSESGQGMTEYILVVALVAISAIGVVTVFGRDVRELFSAATGTMAGGTNVSNGAIQANVRETKGVKDFGKNGVRGDP